MGRHSIARWRKPLVEEENPQSPGGAARLLACNALSGLINLLDEFQGLTPLAIFFRPYGAAFRTIVWHGQSAGVDMAIC